MDDNNHLPIDQLLAQAERLSKDILAIEAVDTVTAYQEVCGKIARKRRHRLRQSLVRYAAMLALPLLLSTMVLAYLHFRPAKQEVQYAEVVASNGTVVRYELPDHSVVWLNSGSRLRYPTLLNGKTRQVELRGEGYFAVKADASSPFYVHTAAGLSVFVYGTHFNVSAYDEEPHVETTLEEGKVNVMLPGKKSPCRLEPGEWLSYDKATGRVERRKVETDEKTSWREGRLIFRNATLEEVFAALERHFNVQLILRRRSQKEYRYRATFNGETLPQILDYLAKSTSMKWQTVDGKPALGHPTGRKTIVIDLNE